MSKITIKEHEEKDLIYHINHKIFEEFINDSLEKTDDPKDKPIAVIQLYHAMKSWYRSNYDGRCPNIRQFREYLMHNIASYDKITDSLSKYMIKNIDATSTISELDNLIL